MSGGNGARGRGPWGPAGDQPPWTESGWPPDQNSNWPPAQASAGRGAEGYGGQDFDAARDSDRGYGEPGSGFGQPGGPPAPGPAPSFQPQGPAAGAQQWMPGPGMGSRPDRRGPDGMPPEPPGYDQRGSGPRPVAARGGGEYPASDDSFVPGFGGRDGFGTGRGQDQGRQDTGRPDRGRQDRGRRDRGGRSPDQAGYDQQYDSRRGADPRWPAGADPAALPGGPPGGWGPDDRGPGRPGPDPYDRRDNWDMRNDRPRRKATRWAPRILLLVVFGGLLAGFLVGGLYIYGKYEAKYHPADYAGAGIKPTVTVQVPSGANSANLAPELVKLGVIASARAFTNAAEASSNPTGLEPGFFVLNHHMRASLAWAALLSPKSRVQLGVTIPEGKRVSQVILILAKETKIPLKNFQRVIDHPAKLGLPSYAKGKVEGYLFPATYAITPHEPALAILQAMVARFNIEAAQVGLPAAAAKLGLTPTQVMIEASMAQAEGGSVADYPKIARVIINRLKDGMHLQFDSALLYGLKAYAINVTYKQIATKGPYNDFEHAGLPPGPIANPGDAAIQGVLHPASGPWLFFLTNTGGKSTFSATPLQGQG